MNKIIIGLLLGLVGSSSFAQGLPSGHHPDAIIQADKAAIQADRAKLKADHEKLKADRQAKRELRKERREQRRSDRKAQHQGSGSVPVQSLGR